MNNVTFMLRNNTFFTVFHGIYQQPLGYRTYSFRKHLWSFEHTADLLKKI